MLPSAMCDRKTVNNVGQFERVKIVRPGVVALYNSTMGGTDLADQLCSYIRTTLRSNKWPVRIFTHFFDLTVTNAFILFKNIFELKSYGIHDYLTDLITELVQTSHPQPSMTLPPDSQDEIDTTTPLHLVRKVSWDTDPMYIHMRLSTDKPHYLVTVKKRGVCRSCEVARVKTACITCKVTLCMPSITDGDSSCFHIFHNCA